MSAPQTTGENDMSSQLYRRARLCLVLLMPILIGAQFKPEEIAQRDELEDFLKTAEIVRFQDIGEGVTKPIRLWLKKGEVERTGAWKNPAGIQLGSLEGWRFEIAAYRLDKLLDLNMVPPTVERVFQGKPGSLQLWVDIQTSLLRVVEENIQIPSEYADRVEKCKYLVRAWDGLIANEDRTQQNYRYTSDWRSILIDHSRAFRSSKEFRERLLTGKNARPRPLLFRRLPRWFVDNVRKLTLENIKEAIGPYLEDEEVKALLIRRDLLIKEIEEMIGKRGESEVLYD